MDSHDDALDATDEMSPDDAPATFGAEIDNPVMTAVRRAVEPIAADLGLDLYDLERRGGTVRVTLDTPPGSPSGVTLDQLSLASRLIGRQLDADDPIAGRYTLEVTSPGVERALRTPQHFQREIGKVVAVRLRDVGHDDRRVTGPIEAADDTSVTVGGRAISYDQIDRAHTVFEWGPAPKPGKSAGRKAASPRPKQETS